MFFEATYIFNMISSIILVWHIHTKKHVEGISFYTQLLFAIAATVKIFYFPYTILVDYWICWIEYFISTACSLYILYLFRKFKRINFVKEKNFFDYRIIIAVALVLAYISHLEKKDSFEFS